MRKTFFSLFSFCLMNHPEWGRGIAQLYYRKFSDLVIFKYIVLKSFLKNLYSSVFSREHFFTILVLIVISLYHRRQIHTTLKVEFADVLSSQFKPRCQLAGKEAQLHAVGSNSLETTSTWCPLIYHTQRTRNFAASIGNICEFE